MAKPKKKKEFKNAGIRFLEDEYEEFEKFTKRHKRQGRTFSSAVKLLIREDNELAEEETN